MEVKKAEPKGSRQRYFNGYYDYGYGGYHDYYGVPPDYYGGYGYHYPPPGGNTLINIRPSSHKLYLHFNYFTMASNSRIVLDFMLQWPINSIYTVYILSMQLSI